MKKEELWALIARRNPTFTRGPVTISAESVRRLFDLAWDKGHDLGVENGRAMAEKQNRKANPFGDMFGNPFGM